MKATFVTKKPIEKLSWLSADAITVTGSDGETYIFDTVTFVGDWEGLLPDGRSRYSLSKYNADHEFNEESNEGRRLKWEAIRDGIWEEFYIIGDLTPEQPESFGNDDLLFEEITITAYIESDGHVKFETHTLTDDQLNTLNNIYQKM